MTSYGIIYIYIYIYIYTIIFIIYYYATISYTLQGDGGGPLMSNDSEFTKIKKDDTKPWVLYGLTSWGLLGCANRRKPHVYTKVSHFVNWIHAIIRGKITLLMYSVILIVALIFIFMVII